MKFSPFKNKLFLWAIFPVLGIVVFSFLSINHSLKTVKQTESVINIVRGSFINNALVHELQKERGMSNVYLSSQGKKFTNELAKQREATDLILLQQQNNLSQLNAIEELAAVRHSVDTLSTTSTQL